MTVWTIWASYDLEANVWYTCDSDVPGLATEGETLAELERRISERFTAMLEGNAHLIVDKSRLEGPHSIRLIAHHEAIYDIAA